MNRSIFRLWLLALGVLATTNCGDTGSDTYGGGYSTSGVSSAATGGDSDGPTGGTTGEVEDEGDFQVPRASGKYVYSASKTTNSVAVINTATLAIDVVGVGQSPTVIQPIPGQAAEGGSVVVLDQGSDDVALLRTTAASGSANDASSRSAASSTALGASAGSPSARPIAGSSNARCTLHSLNKRRWNCSSAACLSSMGVDDPNRPASACAASALD